MAESRSQIRKDLMRRWFAVAISAGFATTLVQMQWLNNARSPNGEEFQQIFRLFVAMTAVICSWDGYFFSIETKPLNSMPRFILDFCLVMIYMVLLYTSKLPYYWLFLHAFSFTIYILWDILSIQEFRSSYSSSGEGSALKIYFSGFRGQSGFYTGPAITACWAIYFWALFSIEFFGRYYNAFALAPFAFVGLILYRRDKMRAAESRTAKNPERPVWYSLLTVMALIAFCYGASVLVSRFVS